MYDAEIMLSRILTELRRLKINPHSFGGFEARALNDFNTQLSHVTELLMEYLRDNESRLSQVEEKLEWLKSLGL
jgi:hypothetical protein